MQAKIRTLERIVTQYNILSKTYYKTALLVISNGGDGFDYTSRGDHYKQKALSLQHEISLLKDLQKLKKMK